MTRNKWAPTASVSRVHMKEVSVHDGRKVRRGTFDGKSVLRPTRQLLVKETQNVPQTVQRSSVHSPPCLQSTRRCRPPAWFSKKVRFTVRGCRTRNFQLNVPRRHRNVQDVPSARPSFFGSTFARAAQNVRETSPAVAHGRTYRAQRSTSASPGNTAAASAQRPIVTQKS